HSIDRHLAAARLEKTQQQRNECRLACSVGTGDADHLAAIQLEREVGQRRHLPAGDEGGVGLGDALETDHSRLRTTPAAAAPLSNASAPVAGLFTPVPAAPRAANAAMNSPTEPAGQAPSTACNRSSRSSQGPRSVMPSSVSITSCDGSLLVRFSIPGTP